ncbi:hypothetical protein M0R45_036956 [Rubus argutus]|uniref:Nodulin-like domain-containing protein n=1 Tax=Rubus argutus TaxID=59490 RepID=A0AAW1W251_RUBAR
MKIFVLQVLKGRWLMVFASFLMMVTAGASYMFGLYSNDIKSVLACDQTTLNLISFSKDLGANIGIFSGLINDATPPWVVLSIGAVLNFFGHFMIWLAIAQKIPKPKVWHMCMYMGIGANSHTFTNTGVLVTCVKNFPKSRGVVIGLLKSYSSISAAVVAQLYHAVYGDDTKHFTLVVAWLPTAISFAFIGTIRIMKVSSRSSNELKAFYNFLYLSLGLALFLLVIIIVEKRVRFHQREYAGTAAIVLFLLFLPLAVVIMEEYKVWESKRSIVTKALIDSGTAAPEIWVRDNMLKHSIVVEKEVSWWEDVFNSPEIGEDYTILQAIFSIEMLTLLFATICGIGGTMTMMDNLGQIGTSFGYPLKSISYFVSLTSIWSYLGQIVAGIGSEIFITKYKWPSPSNFHSNSLALMCWSSSNCIQCPIWSLCCFSGYWVLFWGSVASDLHHNIRAFRAQVLLDAVQSWWIGYPYWDVFAQCDGYWAFV